MSSPNQAVNLLLDGDKWDLEDLLPEIWTAFVDVGARVVSGDALAGQDLQPEDRRPFKQAGVPRLI